MWCAECQNEVYDCTCANFEERMRRATAVVFGWCGDCDKHIDRCRCEKPRLGTMTAGKFKEGPVLH